jgi:hypothetical protein
MTLEPNPLKLFFETNKVSSQNKRELNLSCSVSNVRTNSPTLHCHPLRLYNPLSVHVANNNTSITLLLGDGVDVLFFN